MLTFALPPNQHGLPAALERARERRRLGDVVVDVDGGAAELLVQLLRGPGAHENAVVSSGPSYHCRGLNASLSRARTHASAFSPARSRSR